MRVTRTKHFVVNEREGEDALSDKINEFTQNLESHAEIIELKYLSTVRMSEESEEEFQDEVIFSALVVYSVDAYATKQHTG